MARRIMPLRLPALGAIIGGVLVVALSSTALLEEIFPTQATKVPTLLMAVDLTSHDRQDAHFLIGARGHYRVEVLLELKDGPRGYQAGTYMLRATMQVHDHTGHVRITRDIERALLGHEIGGPLFDFDAKDAGGAGDKTLSLRLSTGPEFMDHYSRMTLLIRRQPRWAIVD